MTQNIKGKFHDCNRSVGVDLKGNRLWCKSIEWVQMREFEKKNRKYSTTSTLHFRFEQYGEDTLRLIILNCIFILDDFNCFKAKGKFLIANV